MNRRLLLAALVPALLGTAAFAWARSERRESVAGPYRVIVTDPITFHPPAGKEVFAEEPRVAEAFNRLEAQGFTPVHVVPLTDDQILIVARGK